MDGNSHHPITNNLIAIALSFFYLKNFLIFIQLKVRSFTARTSRTPLNE